MAGNVWDPGNSSPQSPLSSGTEIDAARALSELARMALHVAREEDNDAETIAGGHTCLKKRNVGGRAPPAAEKNEHEGSTDYCEIKDVKLDLQGVMEIESMSESAQSGSSYQSNRVPSLGIRAKQTLTEVEKEAKRIRRILANRESARQTIRRRQALREELMKKVNDLSLHNQNIKMEKEQILQEYEALKNKNKQLKEQMAKATRPEIDSGQNLELTLASCSSSSSPVKIPALTQNQAVYPTFGWPSWPPHFSPNLLQIYEKGGISKEEHNPGAMPYHIPPYCAWFFPPVRAPMNDTTTNEKPNIKEKDFLEGFAENKPKFESEKQIVTTGSSSSPIAPLNPIAYAKREENVQDVGRINSCEPSQVIPTYRVHTSADAAAGAEARRRRMELTRLKRLHGKHQFKHQI